MIGTLLAIVGVATGACAVAGAAGWAWLFYRLEHGEGPATPITVVQPSHTSGPSRAATRRLTDPAPAPRERRRAQTRGGDPSAHAAGNLVARILAKTFYRELRRNGYAHNEIIGIASELLASVAADATSVKRH